LMQQSESHLDSKQLPFAASPKAVEHPSEEGQGSPKIAPLLQPDSAPEVMSTYHERALEKMRRTGNRPGYPLSAFCIYSQQQRDRLKALNPDVP